jgi:hypothetical protein
MIGGPPFPNSAEFPEGTISVKWDDKQRTGAMIDFKPNCDCEYEAQQPRQRFICLGRENRGVYVDKTRVRLGLLNRNILNVFLVTLGNGFAHTRDRTVDFFGYDNKSVLLNMQVDVTSRS